MIEIKNVTKKFGDFIAVDDASFTVEESSIYGLVGCNGAGKTTLLKTAAGIYRADGGKVLIGGENVFDNSEIRRELFYIPDELYFLPGATMSSMARFYQGYYHNFSENVLKNIMELFGLDPKHRIHGFSKGMQRQAEIAFALACRPKYMLLDECFDGLDPQKRSQCRDLFLEYIAESGCSMIMASHNLPELSNICDHIGLLNGKRLVLDCDINDIASKYAKYRVIGGESMSRDALKRLGCTALKADGKMATFVANGRLDEVEAYLETLGVLDIQRISMTVEEIFMNEMGDVDYDISKIFEA